MKSFKLNLADNARDFVKEALKKAIEAENNPHEWKFAIVHLVQGIELSLKELLRTEHPVLIYKDVDKQTETVSLKIAISRLRKLRSLSLTQDEDSSLTTAINLRNNIIHHEFETTPLEVKAAFAKLLGFLVDFHREHLKDPINTYISPELWHKAIDIDKYGQELFERAKERIRSMGLNSDEILTCPKCGWNALCTPEYANEGVCFVCNHLEEIVSCGRCQKLMLTCEAEELGKNFCCWDCFVYLTDDYWHEDGR